MSVISQSYPSTVWLFLLLLPGLVITSVEEVKSPLSAMAEILVSSLKSVAVQSYGTRHYFVDVDCSGDDVVLKLGIAVLVSLICQTAFFFFF